MAIVRAVKSGNWSDTTVWNTGALPTSADDVYSNTFTVTIDTSPTVLSISNAATTGVSAGGTFAPTNGITLTCTATNGITVSSGYTFSSTLTSGQSCNINANCTGGSNGTTSAVRNNGSGTITITGTCTGGANGGGGNSNAVLNSSTGTINILGAVRGGGTNGVAVENTSTGNVYITGDITGGTATNSTGASNSSTGLLSITGNVTGGTGGYGLVNSSTGTLTVVGQLVASTGSPAVNVTNINGTVILSGPFLTSSNGVNPVYAVRWFWQNTSPPATYYQIRSANLSTIRPLYTADSVGGNPAVTNVRSGTVYGPNNELTGTCAVPAAGSVALGVPVDNTTGTAYITQSDITNALSAASAVTLNQQTSTLTTSGSIGERLKLVSTVATTAQQLSDALSNE